MVLITPIRSDNAYFALGKQSVGGTPVTPNWFPRWADGSSIELDAALEDIKEGDGSRRLSQIIKNRQMTKIKLICMPRMNELGMLEQAACGTGSDTYTAPTISTTITNGGGISAGATTLTVASTTGLSSTGNNALILSPSTANEEIALLTWPGSGTTLTVASTYNGGNGLKLSHANGDAIKAAALHTLTDQQDGDYYTIEAGLGSLSGAAGLTLRVRDCKLETIKRSGKAGGPLIYETEWVGIASIVQASPLTITLEQHSLFLYTQGVWNIDGSTSSNDALSIEQFDITQKNNLDTAIQTEQLTLAALIFGMLDIGVAFDIVYTLSNKIFQTYFGGSSSAGSSDAQAVGLGSFSVIFTQPDTFQSVKYTIATTTYTKTSMPMPKKDGKHYKLSVSGTGTSNQGAQSNVISVAITNSQYAQY